MFIAFMGGVYFNAFEKGRVALRRFRADSISDYEALNEIYFYPSTPEPEYIYYIGKSKSHENWDVNVKKRENKTYMMIMKANKRMKTILVSNLKNVRIMMIMKANRRIKKILCRLNNNKVIELKRKVDKAQQPNYTNLSQALQTVSHEVSFVPNIPNLNVADQLTIIQRSLSNLTDTVTNLSNTVTNLSNTVTNLSNRIDGLTITIQATDTRNLARIYNSRLPSPDFQLEIVPDMAGNVPQNYPQSITAFREMTGHGVNTLMTFYGLPTTGNVEVRRKRFAKYIGVQLI
ncbi:11221_t:CDS:2 [Funneliformis caledonium]|uniref:11221_t:CDS:1 n=1 Tax=Funneliformis caledonium TaxID=1117310 RepID=A0A9N9HEG9_9GLOM|nr:11221_t:CDS:2 [Funneliformis caledonium]